MILSGPTVTNITQASATVTWTTDDASTSIVEYSTDMSFNDGVVAFAPVTNHSVVIGEPNPDIYGGLSTATKYNYRVMSTNAANLTTTSAVDSFTTK